MVKNYKIIIIILLQVWFRGSISAQNGYTPVERLVFDNALSAIEDYESVASVSDEDAYYSLLDLFVNDSAKVYNDLLGLAYTGSLPIKEYAALMQKQTKSTQVYILNIKKDRIWKERGKWKVQYSFEKRMSYSNNCGVYFNSNEFYEKNYNMKATLVFDEERSLCKFERIDGEIESSKKFPENFYTFQRSSSFDDALKFNNRTLKFNSYEQAYLSAPVTKAQFSYADADVVATPVIDDNCKFVTVNYKSRRFALKPHFDMGLGECYQIKDAPSALTHKTSSISFGVDFGYIIPSKSHFKIGVFAGVGLNSSKIDLAYNCDNFYYNTNADIDGETYTRYYNNFSLSQNIKLTDVVIPVYLDFNYHFSKIVSIYADLGCSLNLNINHKISDVSGAADVFGFYNDEDGGHYKKAPFYPFNGFGHVTYDASNVVDADIKDMSSFTADLLAGLGLRFKIPNTPLSVDLGVNYQMGLMNVLNEKSSKPSLNTGSVSLPIAYNEITGTESVECVRNLIDVVSPIKRNALRLHIGLMLKF